MEVKHNLETNKGFFELYDGDSKIGLIEYLKQGEDVIVITHTEVSPDYEGQGLGKKLVDAAAKHARENNLKVKALCPYAKKVMSRSEEYQDLLV